MIALSIWTQIRKLSLLFGCLFIFQPQPLLAQIKCAQIFNTESNASTQVEAIDDHPIIAKIQKYISKGFKEKYFVREISILESKAEANAIFLEMKQAFPKNKFCQVYRFNCEQRTDQIIRYFNAGQFNAGSVRVGAELIDPEWSYHMAPFMLVETKNRPNQFQIWVFDPWFDEPLELVDWLKMLRVDDGRKTQLTVDINRKFYLQNYGKYLPPSQKSFRRFELDLYEIEFYRQMQENDHSEDQSPYRSSK